MLTSCNNQNQEDRLKKLEEQVSKLDSIVSPLPKVNSQQTNTIISNEQSVRSDLNVAQKFVGSWKYYGSVPPSRDNSMNGIICQLERYASTNKTFVFHLWTGQDLVLSILDENTLVGQNVSLSVKYDTKTDHIALIFDNGNEVIYSRLQ